MWHQIYSQLRNGLGIRMHLMCFRTVKTECKWIKLERPVRKVHPGLCDTLFWKSLKWLFTSYWNITVWEISFWPVHFHLLKTRNRASIKGEWNDEGHGDAEWHLQGHCVTKECSSYWSKCQFGFVYQLILMRIFLFFLLLSWFALLMSRSLKWKISHWASENKINGHVKIRHTGTLGTVVLLLVML